MNFSTESLNGIEHRDLKPANLFLRGGRVERVALIDFGVAHAEGMRQATGTGIILGTPDYMAPEQARGLRDISPAVDIFALGCVLYECLTGRPPFAADHMTASLAKILFEDPPPVRELRDGLPDELVALLSRMLAKSPLQRFPDAAALLAELLRLPPPPPEDTVARPSAGGTDSEPPGALDRETAPALTEAEQQLVSFVVALPRCRDVGELPTLNAAECAASPSEQSTLLELLGAARIEAEWLADGSLIATLTRRGTAQEQVEQAARCALLIRAQVPKLRVALATGRGLVHEHILIGEVIERATRLLRHDAATPDPAAKQSDPSARPESAEGVLLDELSASLLNDRFEVQRVAGAAQLHGERASQDDTRRLLGLPTPCVGRESELATLEAFLTTCIEEQSARAVLVTAPPGVGKSRLRHEFVRRARAQHPELIVLPGRGDSISAGSPYGLLGQVLRALCAVPAGGTSEVQRQLLSEAVLQRLPASGARQAAFIGEVCGLPFSADENPRLRAARCEPKIMADQISDAVIDLLGATCKQGPVLILLDDLHWGDALSTRLVGEALRELSEQPLMVLALARPEVEELFPRLWSERPLGQIALRGLSKKASERLVHKVLEQLRGTAAETRVTPEQVATIVEQASGNALYLEELLRFLVEGKGEGLPETVLAMLQSRLGRLPTEARRALRAASIFGRTFWLGGVQALCGMARSPLSGEDAQQAWLQPLLAGELIERHRVSRFQDEPEYSFRHTLVREAAYGLLTDTDQQLGHRLAARYLAEIGETDPLVLAGHAQRGGEAEQAGEYYVKAAAQSYDNNDGPGTLQRTEQAMACGVRGAALGTVQLLRSLVSFYRGDLPTAYELGTEALQKLQPGTARWARALGNLFAVGSLLSKAEHIQTLTRLCLSTPPEPDAYPAYIEAVATQVVMLSTLGQRELCGTFLGRLAQWEPAIAKSDARSRGWLHHCRAFFARSLEATPERTMRLAAAACHEFEEACDLRTLVFARTVLGSAQRELGLHAEGEASLRRAAVALAERLQEPFLLTYAQIYLGLLLISSTDSSGVAEVLAIAEPILSALRMTPIYRGWGLYLRAHCLAQRGELAEALRSATAAVVTMQTMPSAQVAALSQLSHLRRLAGQLEEAVAASERATQLSSRLGGCGCYEIAAWGRLTEAYQAAGPEYHELAARACAQAQHQLQRRLDEITDPQTRIRFLRLHQNLAAKLATTDESAPVN